MTGAQHYKEVRRKGASAAAESSTLRRCRGLLLVLVVLAAGCGGVATTAGGAPGIARSTVVAKSPTAQNPAVTRSPAEESSRSTQSTPAASSNLVAQVPGLEAKFTAQGCGTFDALPTGVPGFSCVFGNQFALPLVSVAIWGSQATVAAHTSASADRTQVVIQSGDVVVLLQARKGSSEATQIAGLVIAAIGGKVVL